MAVAPGVNVPEWDRGGAVLVRVGGCGAWLRAASWLVVVLGLGPAALPAQDFPPESAATTGADLPAVVAPAAPPVRPPGQSARVPAAAAAATTPATAGEHLLPTSKPPAVGASPTATTPVGSAVAPVAAADELVTDAAAIRDAGVEIFPTTEGSPFADALEPVPTQVQSLTLLGESIQPGTRHELRWQSSQSFDGSVVATPVVVLHGARPGPRLCLTAAVHGDELNGIEIIRRVTNNIDVAELAGTVIAVPIVNYLGYSRGTRYLPDRRDLNRYFPGHRSGSSAARIAFGFFNDLARHCHALVDFHTGSFDRSNLPQVRGDLRIAAVQSFARGFGATAVLHSPGSVGMLRRALTDVGIPAVTFELGAPLRLEPSEIDFGVQAMHSLLHGLSMTRSFRARSEPQALFYAAKWVRADTGGMLFAEVELGDRVRVGQRLGKVIDPLQNLERPILSPVRGKVLGMALNQIVLPGFAVFHLGVQTSQQVLAEAAARLRRAHAEGDRMDEDPNADDGLGTPLDPPGEDEEIER